MLLIIENLKEAINGESNAKRKYELYAEQATIENLPEVAKLFKAVAHAESIHIKNHLKALSLLTNEATRVVGRLWLIRKLHTKADQLQTLINIGRIIVSPMILLLLRKKI